MPMQPSALGLTCHDALSIFSQNETLRLQAEVSELKIKLRELAKIWKKKCERQKEKIAWACVALYDADICTGCLWSSCPTCGINAAEVGRCMCLIRTCQCFECRDDTDRTRRHSLVLQPDSNLPSPISCTYEEEYDRFERDMEENGMEENSDDSPCSRTGR